MTDPLLPFARTLGAVGTQRLRRVAGPQAMGTIGQKQPVASESDVRFDSLLGRQLHGAFPFDSSPDSSSGSAAL
jgi:hypothetical protein